MNRKNFFKHINYKLSFFILIISLILLTLNISEVYATEAVDQLPIDEQLLKNPYFDIMIVSFLELDNEQSTNANPPKGKMEIIEVLRGSSKLGVISAFFDSPSIPPEHQKEWISYEKVIPTEEWADDPFNGPEIGEHLIVFTQQLSWYSSGPVEIVGTYEFSEDTKEMILREMGPIERVDYLTLFLIMLLPAISLVLYILSFKSSLSPSLRNLFRIIILLIPLLIAGLYFLYDDSGISDYSNIRVDLAMIWFALILSFVFLPLLVIHYLNTYWRKKKSTKGSNESQKDSNEVKK